MGERSDADIRYFPDVVDRIVAPWRDPALDVPSGRVVVVDEPAARGPAEGDPAPRPLPAYLVAGNRFGSWAFGAGLSGLLLTLAPFGHTLAWVLGVAAVVLGVVGFARYTRGGATNRDTAVVGQALGWVGVAVLSAEAQVALIVPLQPYFWLP